MALKTLREKRRLSQEQLAMMAGLSIRTIQRIESGHKPGLESLKALAAVLQVDVSQLEQEMDVNDKPLETASNDRPRQVTHAVIALYGSLLLAAIAGTIDVLRGDVHIAQYIVNLLLYSLLCIVPYKISNGSNAARYVFFVMAIGSNLSLVVAAGIPSAAPAELIAAFLTIPIDIYAFVMLVTKEANRWFAPKVSTSPALN